MIEKIWKNKKGRCISPAGLFLLGSVLTVIFGFLQIMKTDGEAWNTILFYSWNDYFMDFYNHVSYVENPSTVYWSSVHACFPAFAYIFYFALNRMIPSQYTEISTLTRDNPYGGIIFLIYMLAVTLFFIFVVDEYLRKRKIEKLLVFISCFLQHLFYIYLKERIWYISFWFYL